MTEIPYTVEPRPDSRLTNPTLGLWLFLASEAMVFASLFSAYTLLRIGAEPGTWPAGGERLHVGSGALNTVVLMLSSALVYGAWQAAKRGSAHARVLLMATAAMGSLFVLIKINEYRRVVAEGFVPSTDIFTAIYFVLTGVHALHLLGGIVVVAYLAGPGFELRQRPRQFVQRTKLTGVYWHFVDVVWLIIFVLLYLS